MTPSAERAPVFRRYDPKQSLLLPPNLDEWFPEEHLARFISEIVEGSLGLSPLIDRYTNAESGHPAVPPKMLTKLLVYGYAIGVRSSRKIERATYEEVAFRYLTANQLPDHYTIARFRERNLDILEGLFIQGLKIADSFSGPTLYGGSGRWGSGMMKSTFRGPGWISEKQWIGLSGPRKVPTGERG